MSAGPDGQFPPPFSPGEAVRLAEVETVVAADQAHDNSRRRWVAAGVGASGFAVAAAVVASEHFGFGNLSQALPFLPEAQQVVTNIEDGLEPVGEVGIPLTLIVIASVKALAPHNNRARFIDDFSAHEPSADTAKHRRMRVGRRHTAMAVAGAALATLTASISTEVGEGPNRAIDAFNEEVPGNVLIVQYPEAMPMVQSGVAPTLAEQVRAEARRRQIATHGFALNLGTYTYDGRSYTDLFAGVETTPSSPIAWNGVCEDVPAIVDGASGAPKGATIVVNGIRMRVAGTTSNGSSMNRVSGLVDKDALKTCLAQDPTAPDFGMSLETDEATAQQILDAARTETGSKAPASVITKEEEKANSELFWDENVKPITGVLSLAALGLAGMAVASSMGNRLLRNRRELGARLAAGVSINTLRAAELMRAAKDGVYAGLAGATIGIFVSVAPNAIQQGFLAGAGERELAIGAGVGLAGSVGGAVIRLVGLKKVANPEETTRI